MEAGRGGKRRPTAASAVAAARAAYALILLAIAVVLMSGGGYLVTLGGSPYYLLAGIAIAVSGVLVWRGDCRAAWLYGAMLAATLAWAVWEAGLDGWALMPRLLAPAVLGLGFLWRPLRATRDDTGARQWWTGWLGFAAALIAACAIGLLIHSATGGEPADPIYQAGGADAPVLAASAPAPAIGEAGDWTNYGNDAGGSRYSPLDQITPANVGRLKVAWTLRTGAGSDGLFAKLQVTPLEIGGSVYVCTAWNDVLSVDAETGRVKWRFRSGIRSEGLPTTACRGVAHYNVPGANGPCAERIVTATIDARLIALDAATGRLCEGFGTHGQTSLLAGMGKVPHGYYLVTSAPTIVRGKIVVGGWVSDGQYWGEPSGVIRAYDAVTGKFAWAFDMGRPGDHREPPGGRHYTPSTPNSWAPMSADERLGLVYAPTGNATPDYYGAQRRPFDNRYSSSVLALDAETGALRWTFQTMHHDLWDYDVASQPTLVDLPSPRGVQRVLVQPTKRGEIFVLDRATGRPLAPVVERPVPQTGIAPGERLSPTQPFSVAMPSFAGPALRERDMWGVTPLDQMLCRIRFKQARHEGFATPPGLTPSVFYPGYVGGVDWGGVSVDRARKVMIVNSGRMAIQNQLLPRSIADARGIRPAGNGHMSNGGGAVAQANTPYAADVRPFFSPLGVPCNEPPYGLIAAVDLVSRKVLWSKPLGTARDSGPLGIASGLPITMGVPNTGGSVITRGGIVFIGATQERTFRALDLATGRELWSARLPGGGLATPMTYRSNRSGRQFVVIAAGGGMNYGSRESDAIVAFALPQ